MTQPLIEVEVSEHVATVTLNRPPVNALNQPLRREIIAAFETIHERKDVRVVVLTGAGKIFSAGADIKERAAIKDEPGDHGRLNRIVRELFYAVMECSKPVIAAVNGPAIGAGFALTLCCDILVASQDATFAMPEIDVGMAGGVKFLQRHFSPSKSRWLMLSGTLLAHPRCRTVFGWPELPLQQAAERCGDPALTEAAASLARIESAASSNLLLVLPAALAAPWLSLPWRLLDRKSTRLNSSHRT